MARSYRDEWSEWGICTALQTLLMYQKPPYTVEDLMNVAKMYGVDEQLIERMSYVPNSTEGYF
jgi:hypothetical protein